MLTQLSDKDKTVLEINHNTNRFIINSMYLDIINNTDAKITIILDFAKEKLAIVAMDSKSRWRLWHDALTNRRGRILEEFLLSQQLFTMNDGNAIWTDKSTK